MKVVNKRIVKIVRSIAWNALVIGLLFKTTSLFAQNLVTNPGFEFGNTAGWFPFGSPTLSVETTVVHTGTYACLVANRTSSFMGAAQSFGGILQTGQVYNVSAWVQMVNDNNQTVQIECQQIDGNGTTFSTIAQSTVSAGGWTQLSGQFVLNVTGTLTNLNFYIQVTTSATDAYYIDDMSVSVPSTNGTTLVDAANIHQRIDGFGASSAWRGTWTMAQENMFFSTNVSGTGTSLDGKTNFAYVSIGLSLLRNRIAPANSSASNDIPSTLESSVMVAAQARGARVWSTPWTPASGFKSNDSPNGGNYLGSGGNATNVAYADQLASYIASMKNTFGVNIYALSLQNEPDANVTTYDAAVWTGAQFHDFVTNLSSAMINKGVSSTKIMLPESQNWAINTGLYAPTMNDSNTAAVVGILADHDYVANNVVGDTSTPAPLPVGGRAMWETEVAQLSQNSGTYDPSINNAVYWAGRVHLFMTAAQANAWHYWWLIADNNDNEGLTDTNGIPAKRMYALGQFSRFVRPNFNRIDTSGGGDAEVSAYRDATSPHFAIVAINPDPNAISQVFTLTNFNPVSQLIPWMTSASSSLVQQATVLVTNQTFTYTLPAMSIVTFVGVAVTNSPPVLSAVAPQTINAGVMLNITNNATDTNLPPPTLTFNLLNPPAGASVNPANGIFTWRPLVSQANTANTITVTVGDNYQPSAMTTNKFTVTVNPISQPSLGSAAVTGGHLSFTASGPSGPDYSLLVSTNLRNWQLLYKSNSPALPVTLVDTNPATNASQFYRVQIGP